MKINLPKGKEIVVVTGPESSGKTTLVHRLRDELGLPIVEEYARVYLDSKPEHKYEYKDLQIIGKCQNIQESEAHKTYPIIICDTDIITIDIWSMEVFGKAISLPNLNSDKKHYLLCKPDISWVSDPLRENPKDRDRLFAVYSKYLEGRELSFEVLDEVGRNGMLL